jgi:integrase
MPTITGEGYLSNKVNQAGTYYAFLVIDGQKVRRSTGTKDLDDAVEFLGKWKAQAEVGVIGGDSRVRYEGIRDNYLDGSKSRPSDAILRDLDNFFWKTKDSLGQFKKNASIFISAITPTKIKQFRQWRESQERVLEYKAETFQKEFALRKLKAQNGHSKKLTSEQIARIESEARQWVENGVKATTNRRLTVLRAMFNHAAKEEMIKPADVPATFCLWENVDNVKMTKYTAKDFQNLLEELPGHRAFLEFLFNTGMRSGQAKAITWDMIDERHTLVMPGFTTKNGQAYSLTLVDENDKPYPWAMYIVNMKVKPHGLPVFDTTSFRSEWRRACHKLKLGIFNEQTQAYRGAEPHDFRRTAATNMIANGANETDAMSVTGHRTDYMFKRYQIVTPDSQRRALSGTKKLAVA